jgi:hypothetical protein
MCNDRPPYIRRPHVEVGAKKIAEMGRTAEPHGIGDFRDRLVRVLRRSQKIVASLQSPEPQPF